MTTADDVRRKQQLLHDVNHAIAGIATGWEETRSGFLCECGRDNCTATLELELEELEGLHGRRNLFIVSRGHAVADVDSVQESRDGYDLVRMRTRGPTG